MQSKLQSRTKPGCVRSLSYGPVNAWPRIGRVNLLLLCTQIGCLLASGSTLELSQTNMVPKILRDPPLLGKGQKRRSLGIFTCMPKIREPMLIKSTFLFSSWNRKSKTDDPVIISSLLSLWKQKRQPTHFAPPYSFCPTILILPNPTLLGVI